MKRFNLTVSAGQWSILKDKTVGSYAINGQVPGPRLELEQGDQVEIVVKNDLPESTTLHWHGLILDNEMDGPAHITQKPIEPGEVTLTALLPCRPELTSTTLTTKWIVSRGWACTAH